MTDIVEVLQEAQVFIEPDRPEYELLGKAADAITTLRAQLEKATGGLEKLARLGNGDIYGNSHGNTLAQATLAAIKG